MINMKAFRFLVLILIVFAGCSSENDKIPEDPASENLYFPPVNSNSWETVSSESLGWNTDKLSELYSFLNDSGTKAFIILKDGKIAVEWYGNGANSGSNLPWNSAGKTLTAFMVGISQQEGYLSIDETSQKYLGEHWSILTLEQEQNIKIRNHISMTTGLDYEVENIYCYDPECLKYLNEPGTFWYYHNAPYTLTQDIIEGATGKDFKTYFNNSLRDKIGMQGAWISIGYNHIYFSTARSMARFGLLNMNKGVWDGKAILTDQDYFEEMVNTSQNLNKAYGYLWWLNGKSSFRLPGTTDEFSGELIPEAPADMYAGLGANDQKLYVSPSKGLVVVRMGDSAGEAEFGLSSYDNELWKKINAVLN